MGIVFCRGCGKEIHDTAPTCPHCGAPQWTPQAPPGDRNVALLIGLALAWTIVMWFGVLVIVGVIAGVTHPHDASGAGRRIGEAIGPILLLVSLCVSVGMTIAGVLPGTGKRKAPRLS